MSSRPLSDIHLLRILEESDGEDEVSLELDDAAVNDSIDIQLPLEDQELLGNEDSIEVIEQFIRETIDPVQPSDSPAQTHPPSRDWHTNLISLPRESFTGYGQGLRHEALFNVNDDLLWDIFCAIFDRDLILLMVAETNRYARQQLESGRSNTRNCRLTRWKDVTPEEITRFLGVYLLTGLLSFPTLESYWKKDTLYYHPLLHGIGMSYNRFSLILRCWHFSDNQADHGNQRLYKIQPFIDKFITNCRNIYTPGEIIAVDESMVGFRGRLAFRTFNPQKSNKYGMKIYKLCASNGYTWSYKIYCGLDDQVEDLDKPGSVVVNLSRDLLNEGRILIADNYYTSVPLARFLKTQKTDFCGTVRKTRRGLPHEVVHQPLKKGEVAAQQNNCMTCLKWHDKRDVFMLSTCHNHEMQLSGGFRPIMKPKMILTYNNGKKGIDLADQLASYNSPVRKTCIWYKKIAADVLSIGVVNAIILHNELNPTKKIRLLAGHEYIIRKLLAIGESAAPATGPTRSLIVSSHKITNIPRKANGKIVRKRCLSCYKKLKDAGSTTKEAQKKSPQVHTECKQCNKPFCIPCFNEFH